MNSDKIFEYSEQFLDEIISDILRLKSEKVSNPVEKILIIKLGLS